MSKSETVKMVALMSRPARDGRKALKPGDRYDATAQEARDDRRRGFGELAPADQTGKART
jgi:hypothetical protein